MRKQGSEIKGVQCRKVEGKNTVVIESLRPDKIGRKWTVTA